MYILSSSFFKKNQLCPFQIPQFILDNFLDNYTGFIKNSRNRNRNECHDKINIVCTQPRQISAISLARRVADERLDKLGNVVGYQVRQLLVFQIHIRCKMQQSKNKMAFFLPINFTAPLYCFHCFLPLRNQVRFESLISSHTRLSYCTTGYLLRKFEGDQTLSNLTHVIIDEVHERSEER